MSEYEKENIVDYNKINYLSDKISDMLSDSLSELISEEKNNLSGKETILLLNAVTQKVIISLSCPLFETNKKCTIGKRELNEHFYKVIINKFNKLADYYLS